MESRTLVATTREEKEEKMGKAMDAGSVYYRRRNGSCCKACLLAVVATVCNDELGTSLVPTPGQAFPITAISASLYQRFIQVIHRIVQS